MDLHGKVSYPILDVHVCPTVHCMSRGFVKHIHQLEPSEQARIGKHLQDRRVRDIRDYQMRKVYGESYAL